MSEQPDEDQSTDQTSDQSTSQTTGQTTGQTGDRAGSETAETGATGEVTDAQLPEDLQPGEENPLATHPAQTGDDADQVGADREEDPETAPLTRDEADYGSGAGGSSDSDSSSGGDGPGDGRVDAAEDDGSEALDNGGGGAG